MYTFLLYTHSWLRWVVFILMILAVFKSLIGLFSGGTYQKLDNTLAASFVGTMHLQLLLGLILYFFVSPLVGEARAMGYGAAMKEPDLRFWAVEHLALMILAVIFAQAGRSISKKSDDSVVKYRFQSIFFGAAMLLIILGIPWAEAGRMFRF